jgi:putative Mg2+ transporter-C (MgtC) family protein
MSELEIILRTLAAFGFGLVLGLEREFLDRPAGLRTHALVCMAGALLSATSMRLIEDMDLGGEALRLPAAVITGIGFIGAGAILRNGGEVKGVTTAATVFAAATIGVITGMGLFAVAGTATGLSLFAALALRPFKNAVDGAAEPAGAKRDGQPEEGSSAP